MTVELRCAGCDRVPEEISEYRGAGAAEGETATLYVWSEEGTLNRVTGQFLCTACYIRAGMPEAPSGWKVPPGWERPW